MVVVAVYVHFNLYTTNPHITGDVISDNRALDIFIARIILLILLVWGQNSSISFALASTHASLRLHFSSYSFSFLFYASTEYKCKSSVVHLVMSSSSSSSSFSPSLSFHSSCILIPSPPVMGTLIKGCHFADVRKLDKLS